jgi:hypothetical protein
MVDNALYTYYGDEAVATEAWVIWSTARAQGTAAAAVRATTSAAPTQMSTPTPTGTQQPSLTSTPVPSVTPQPSPTMPPLPQETTGFGQVFIVIGAVVVIDLVIAGYLAWKRIRKRAKA